MIVVLLACLALLLGSFPSGLVLAALPILVAATRGDPSFAMLGIILFVLATVKHRENILRLAAGKEPKVRRPWS